MTKSKKTQEDKTIAYIERRYCYERRQRLYIANEETNQVWDETDIPDFITAWNNNWSLSEIAEYLGADQHEIQLLAADLIRQGKIEGNVHIFKPKRKKEINMESITINDYVIRANFTGSEFWVCLKDVWNWIKKPESTYRKVTETWGPEHRAKFTVHTDGGPQKCIFINLSGLHRLAENLDPWQKNQIVMLAMRIKAATSKRQKNTKSRRKFG